MLRESCWLARPFLRRQHFFQKTTEGVLRPALAHPKEKKDESKGVQVAKLSLTDNENEVMVQTVRASADGKRGKVSMLSALRAMQRSMRLECESAHNQGVGGVVTANALGLGVGTTSNSAELLQHQSSYSSDVSFLDGILPSKLPPTSNPDLSHPGSNGGTPKKKLDPPRTLEARVEVNAAPSARPEMEVELQLPRS